jgi:hypothetical protein
LFFLQPALDTLPLKHLSHLFHSSRANCSSVFIPDVEEKLRVDWKKDSSQATTHDSVFGEARVVSLDIDRDVSLYRRRTMPANSCACANSSPASSWTAMRWWGNEPCIFCSSCIPGHGVCRQSFTKLIFVTVWMSGLHCLPWTSLVEYVRIISFWVRFWTCAN